MSYFFIMLANAERFVKLDITDSKSAQLHSKKCASEILNFTPNTKMLPT